MDGSLAGTLTRDDLRALSRRSDAAGALQLGLHATTIAATATGIALAAGSWWLVPAMAVHGAALVFLFAPLHETIHRTAFRSRRANLVVAWICGLVLAIPPTDFRCYHWAHHRFTQDPERDPELAVPKPATFGHYLRHLSGLPFWRDRLAALLRQASGRAAAAYLPERERHRVVREARLFLLAYAGIALGCTLAASPAPLVYWLGPVLLGQPALRAFLLAEHTGCALTADMARNTRTTLTARAVRLLGWNMPYHAEHHLHPSVPFHALPRLHALIGDRLAHLSPSYRAAHREIRATLR